MIVVILQTEAISFPEPKELAGADVVLTLRAGRNLTVPPHMTLVDVVVLRSRFGDPFHVTVPLDLAYADPALQAERQKTRDDEIAAARATLERHGVAHHPPGDAGQECICSRCEVGLCDPACAECAA